MARRPKGRQPAVGDRIRFVTWPTDKEAKEGVATTLLSTQFVILGDDTNTYMKFYTDYGSEWKIVQDANKRTQ